VNDLLSSVYESILVEGEVASFKVNQGKFAFFELKDTSDGTIVNVFMMKFRLTVPIEDGMRVVVRGHPKLMGSGRFSFTAMAVQPVGEGNIKKAFELVHKKLSSEGLFDEASKKSLPDARKIKKIGVVSSTAAAGFHDFIKILNERRGGIKITAADTVVQGVDAPASIVRGIARLDSMGLDAIAIVRGGGSTDDLAAFNDEGLVRAIHAAKTPIIVGVGHETDTTLADLAADLRASTPSNAAQFLSFDMRQEVSNSERIFLDIRTSYLQRIGKVRSGAEEDFLDIYRFFRQRLRDMRNKALEYDRVIEAMNPEIVLKRGYALVRGEADIGSEIDIAMFDKIIKAEVKNVEKR
jgi:exodeoxyribonuclease VII large subunit